MSTRLPEEIIPDNDQTRARVEHLERVRALVGNAYPNRFERSRLTKSDEQEDTITSIVKEFGNYEPEVKEGERPTPEQLETANATLNEVGGVRVSGRLATPPRVMGKAAFVHLSDGKERLQIYVRKQEARAISNDSLREVEEEESGWKLFQLLDHGDFVGVEGRLFVTKTGELSVHVETIQFLSKALLPMPDKLHGINDPEIRQRQRYADLIASSLKVKTDEEPEGADTQHELSTREVFERRSKLISAMRRHLDDHGYIEVETPMLSPIASGAAARPFKTHHNALDIDLYLRIAPELYLKRLLVGGFERVYELNRNFRNEGISTRHNPEFTMLEFYTAYKDVNWMMDFCEEMLKSVVIKVTGRTQFKIDEGPSPLASAKVGTIAAKLGTRGVVGGIEDLGGTTVDFATFERRTMKSLIIEKFLSKFELSEEDLSTEPVKADHWLDKPRNVALLYNFVNNYGGSGYFNKAENALYKEEIIEEDDKDDDTEMINKRAWQYAKVEFATQQAEVSSEDAGAMTVHLFESLVEPSLRHERNPIFITDFPKSVSPLSKASPDNPAIAERFELYVAGMEVANGFSELNDPAEQLERFEEQAGQRERGDEEAMQTDLDYVRALSYGMPPAAGIGIGIDRMSMLLTNRRSIRDVILFPHMRQPPRPHSKEAEESEGEGGAQEDSSEL
jgi:lysyl-tRNA synthetase class 2